MAQTQTPNPKEIRQKLDSFLNELTGLVLDYYKTKQDKKRIYELGIILNAIEIISDVINENYEEINEKLSSIRFFMAKLGE